MIWTFTAQDIANAAPVARTITIGIHREKPRLWLEGAWLRDAGFAPGVRFIVAYPVDGVIELQIPDGDQLRRIIDSASHRVRRVSKKQKGAQVPVIDINANELPFAGAAGVAIDMAGVPFGRGRLVIVQVR